MANKYISRTSISAYNAGSLDNISQTKLRDNYKNMLNNVTNMLNNEGPLMSTWIKFKIGKSKPVIFDTSSTNPKQNLIAQLNFEKTGAGVSNTFNLTIQYDPFNMGQETSDVIEQLDEYIATAMGIDFNTDSDVLLGTIQYGYNSLSDSSLVSPEYTFYLTEANTSVKFDSGISTYTFGGTSIISSDCDNVVNFEAKSDTSIKVLDYVIQILYKWYGSSDKVPKYGNCSNITPYVNDYGYNISISEECYNNSPVGLNIEQTNSMTPWDYCKSILTANPLSKPEQDSGDYNDLTTLSYIQRPRYEMSINDSSKTIYISHIVPAYTNSNSKKLQKSELSLDYTFQWGKRNQKQNLVINWKPEVDTKLYLIRKARVLRAQSLYEDALKSDNEEVKKSTEQSLTDVNDDLNEMYNAQLQIVGIPADPPIGMELGVMPTILETVSRTSGVYIVIGGSDTINSSGVFISTLRLIRVRGLDDSTIKYELTPNETDTKQPEEKKVTISKVEWDKEPEDKRPSNYVPGGTYA